LEVEELVDIRSYSMPPETILLRESGHVTAPRGSTMVVRAA
jgi:hypothetical protein